jgi:N-acetylglucosaminyl-diphospho-decaprenol L-rhamnosyltransferase
VAVEVSFCVVNTELRELLLSGLDAIAGEQATLPFASEVIVLDNASTDGSAGAARRHPAVTEVLQREQRRGWSENVTTVLQRARGRYCMLLNEDAELHPGAVAALHAALEADRKAAVASTKLFRPDGTWQPSAWRFPSPWTAFVTALWLHRRLVVQSRGTKTRRVDWAQSCAILIRRPAAEEVGWWDASFFVYSDEVDFQRRLADAGWHTLYVPAAEATHHEQLSTGTIPERRIVEFSRNRDRYMRKHHSAFAAWLVRIMTAWTYAVRAVLALGAPGHNPRRYWRHVTATLFPSRGEGVREAAYEYNRGGRRL